MLVECVVRRRFRLQKSAEYPAALVANIENEDNQNAILKRELAVAMRSLSLPVPAALLPGESRFDMGNTDYVFMAGMLDECVDLHDKRLTVKADLAFCTPWNNKRLESLMQMGDPEFKAFLARDPPSVVKIGVRDGNSLYMLSTNGNHRLFAAKLRAYSDIPVVCESEVPSLTGMHVTIRSGETFCVGDQGKKMQPKRFKHDDAIVAAVLSLRGADVETGTGSEPVSKILKDGAIRH